MKQIDAEIEKLQTALDKLHQINKEMGFWRKLLIGKDKGLQKKLEDRLNYYIKLKQDATNYLEARQRIGSKQ